MQRNGGKLIFFFENLDTLRDVYFPFPAILEDTVPLGSISSASLVFHSPLEVSRDSDRGFRSNAT